MTPAQLIEQWRRGLRIAHRAHFEAAKHYERLHAVIGTPAVIISAMLGTTLFASFQHSELQWVKSLLAVLSVTMIVLTSLQAFFRYAERSERHKTAAVQLGEVRREFEQQLVFNGEHPLDETMMEPLRRKWDSIDRQAPTIPTRVYQRVERLVTSEEEGEARAQGGGDAPKGRSGPAGSVT